MSNIDELIERLRHPRRGSDLSREAADALEQLQAENERLQHDVARYIDIATGEATERDRLAARVSELETVLRKIAQGYAGLKHAPREEMDWAIKMAQDALEPKPWT